MKQCWLPPLSFFPHFICKNTYHHLHLHLRKNAQTLKTFAGHGSHKLLSLNVMAVSPPPCYMTVVLSSWHLPKDCFFPQERYLALRIFTSCKSTPDISDNFLDHATEEMDVAWFAPAGWGLSEAQMVLTWELCSLQVRFPALIWGCNQSL